MMTLTGQHFIGSMRVAAGTVRLFSVSAVDQARSDTPYLEATEGEVSAAANAANAAFDEYSALGLGRRAGFLQHIAGEIEAVASAAVAVAARETALPVARLESEVQRTTRQLRLFADVVARGDFLGARINTADGAAPDIRQIMQGIGPVAVFGASNFPFAFSVAGGDTASALAAGCPVVVKAHPLHMATSEVIAGAVVAAARKAAVPDGTFNMIFGAAAGAQLVGEPAIKAVGFTGSKAGGCALAELAARRKQPIPVFAEMSSVNPMFVLPEALAARGVESADGLVASMTLGCGQFCTCPGIVVMVRAAASGEFIRRAAERVRARNGEVMLSRGLLDNYNLGAQRLREMDGVSEIAKGAAASNEAAARLFIADKRVLFEPDAPLLAEVFGPSTVIVEVDDAHEFLQAATVMGGQLTATVVGEDAEILAHGDLVAELTKHAGRVLFNGFPTGVAVNDAVVHGGPFPATTDPRFTSVGSRAIERFLRPVCYQNAPPDILPPGLADANPWHLRRLINGAFTTDPL